MLRHARCAHPLQFVCFAAGIPRSSAGVREAEVASAVVGSDGLVHIRRERSLSRRLRRARSISIAGNAILGQASHPSNGWEDGLLLIIYQDGRIVNRVRARVPLPIWKWVFVDGGSRVAYYSETVDGGLGRRCELLDLEIGKVLDVWDRSQDERLARLGQALCT